MYGKSKPRTSCLKINTYTTLFHIWQAMLQKLRAVQSQICRATCIVVQLLPSLQSFLQGNDVAILWTVGYIEWCVSSDMLHARPRAQYSMALDPRNVSLQYLVNSPRSANAFPICVINNYIILSDLKTTMQCYVVKPRDAYTHGLHMKHCFLAVSGSTALQNSRTCQVCLDCELWNLQSLARSYEIDSTNIDEWRSSVNLKETKKRRKLF